GARDACDVGHFVVVEFLAVGDDVRLDVRCEQRFPQRWHGLTAPSVSPSIGLTATVAGDRPVNPECSDMLITATLVPARGAGNGRACAVRTPSSQSRASR